MFFYHVVFKLDCLNTRVEIFFNHVVSKLESRMPRTAMFFYLVNKIDSQKATAQGHYSDT